MAKRITFDSKVIETLYTSLRQFSSDRLEGSVEWHTQIRMDDVDYLVEENTRGDFAYHRKWMGPMVEWHIGGASWKRMQMLGMILVTGEDPISRE